MIVNISGNILRFICEESDIGKQIPYTLPDGYSLHQYILYRNTSAITLFSNTTYNEIYISNNVIMTFPIVNSMSPNSFIISVSSNATTSSWIELFLLDFGGIPNSHYFDKVFEPVIIKTKDENGDEIEYNMIPSTQFER